MPRLFYILLFTVLISLDCMPVSAQDDLYYFKSNGKYGFKDSEGNIVIRPHYDDASPFKEGVAIVKQKGKYGFIDKTDKFVIRPQYDEAFSFNEGLARVKKNGKWGFIDKMGKFVIQPQFDDAWRFSEGLAPVKQNDKYGFIDTTGNFVIRLQFDYAGLFSEGLAPVKQNGKWGFIDKTGKFVIQPQYDEAFSFDEGFARVKQNDKSGYIDIHGKYYDTKEEVRMALNESSWESYLAYNLGGREDFLKSKGLKAPDEAEVKNYVQREIEKWQKRDEFESTAEWQARVNDVSLNTKAQEIARRYVEESNKSLAAAQKEYDDKFAALLADYKTKAAARFAKEAMSLKPYDADNETFLVTTATYGDIPLPVVKAEARDFKANWENIRQKAKPEFALSNGKMVLKSVNFGKYAYDANVKVDYEQAPAAATYRPVDLSSLSFGVPAPAPSSQTMKVKSFDIVPKDLTARVGNYSRLDTNGLKCAIIKVQSSDNVVNALGSVVGEPVRMGAETWIYMCNRSKEIELMFEKHLPLHVRFNDYDFPTVTSEFVYKMVLTEE